MKIVYYSGTGNTKAMADLISEGIKSKGKEVELLEVLDSKVEDIINEEVIILGCSSNGVEQLDEEYMEPFVESLEGKIKGKKVALFGSWGWGDGQWMKEWEERMKSYGAELIAEGLTVQEMPEGEDEEKCREFGRSIAL